MYQKIPKTTRQFMAFTHVVYTYKFNRRYGVVHRIILNNIALVVECNTIDYASST